MSTTSHRVHRTLFVLSTTAAMTVAPLAATDASPSGSTSAPSTVASKKAPKTLFGSTAQRRGGETAAQALKRTDRKFGGVDVVRAFHTGLPASWSSLRSNYKGRRLVVSFKADPVAIASGRHDRFLTRWFRHAPKKKPTFWSYYHEPEDNIEAGQFTAAQYRRAWKHLKRLEAKAHNPKLKSTLILMAWSLNPSSGRSWKDYYVRSAVDVLGWDAYNYLIRKNSYLAPKKMFRKIIRISARQNRPYGIAEFGSLLASGDNGDRREAWLRRAGRYLKKHDARFVTYFDSDVGGDFRLRDRPSKRGWRFVVNRIG